MRFALILVVALAGCASKKPAKAPAPPENATKASPETQDSAAPDTKGAPGGGPAKPGDPCDGSETKKK